jgi:hypothetical protein
MNNKELDTTLDDFRHHIAIARIYKQELEPEMKQVFWDLLLLYALSKKAE